MNDPQFDSPERDKQILERLVRLSAALFNARDERELLKRIVEGIQIVGFDRARLYLLSNDRQVFIGQVHVGMGDSFVGSEWPVLNEFWAQSSPDGLHAYLFKRSDGRPVSFEGSIRKERVKEWVWMPLAQADGMIGGLSADNLISRRPITQGDLDLLSSFASQVSSALENFRRLAEAQRRAQNLSAVLKSSAQVNSYLDLDRILSETCQAAVKLIGVSHSGFVRFGPNFEIGQVCFEFPDRGTVGQILPLRDIPAWKQFIESRRPFVVPDVANEPSLGLGRELLRLKDIRSILIVPVVGTSGLLGSFGLDSIGAVRQFTDEEVELCQVFADQVAVAIEKAERFGETKQEAEQYQHLWRTTVAIKTPLDRDTLLHTIIQQAVGLLKAESGGIYQHAPETGKLALIVEHNRQEGQAGKTLKLGDDTVRQLVKSGKPFKIIEDYSKQSRRAKTSTADERRFGAFLAVPLKWDGQIIGVLYIADEVGRKFTPQDARWLSLFADQSAFALVNIDLTGKDEAMLKRLEMLSRVTEDIIGKLSGAKLNELLNVIAKHATEILNAETCGVFLVWHEKYVSLEASYGHAEGRANIGKRFRIVSGRKTGLTGHIARKGVLFNKHGAALTTHRAVRGGESSHSPSGECYSLLAIPLKKKVGKEEKLIGLLRIDNKKDADGRALPTLKFTQEDERILSHFAETVVVAIESAEFVEQLREQQDNLSRFINSSPNAIIAVDVRGNVTGFNTQAENILGYKASEVMHTPVDRLYYGPQESREIGRQLRLTDGKLTNYDTFVRSKENEKIAIRLSATWINDEKGERIGSVGYFDRSLKEIQALLLQASDIVANSDSLPNGLQKLAEKIMRLVPHTFCRISLMDESKKFLVVTAAHSVTATGGKKDWTPRLKEHLIPAEWMGLDEVLREGKPRIIRWSNKRSQSNLRRLSHSLNYKKAIQSLLLIPLKVEDKDVGLLEIGELRNEERSSFPQAEIDLMLWVAAQTTILIVLSLYRNTNRLKEELERLHQAAKAMAEALDLQEVLQIIVERAKEMFGADSSALWSYDSAQEGFIPNASVAANISVKEFQRFKEKNPEPGRTMHAILERGWVGISDVSSPKWSFLGPTTRDLLKRIKVKSFAAIALKVADEPVGVLYINYRQPRTFGEADRHALENFAAYAALSLRRARLLHQVNTAKFMSEAVASMTALEDIRATLRSVASGTRSAVGCDAVVFYTYDQAREKLNYPPTYEDVRFPEKAWPYKAVPTSSFVYEMLWQDAPRIVERVNEDEFFKNSRFARVEGIKSCVAIPLKVADERVGVMFVNYRTPHRFMDDELISIKLFSDQAAVAIQNAQRHELNIQGKQQLEHLHKAAKEMAGAFDTQALQVIAERAKDMFEADSSVLWPYEEAKARFTHDYPVAIGIPPLEFQRFEEEDPRPGRTSSAVLEEGWISVPDISSSAADFLGQTTRDLLKRVKVKSFAGIALKVADEPVGVLYINYNQPRTFGEADRRQLENFAGYAALSLKKARLLHQVNTAKFMSEVVASMTALGDSRATLLSVTSGTRSAVGCDAVVLYTYDQAREKLNYPPTYEDVHFPEKAWSLKEVPLDSLVYSVLREDTPHIVERINEDELFRGKRFALDEGIESCVAIPLKVADERVGVMFVNYRTPHRFTHDELISIKLFSDQAAVAISNAQLYEQAQKRTAALRGLYDAGRAITSSLSKEDTLQQISQQALRIIGNKHEGCFSHVAHRVGNRLEFISASSKEILEMLQQESPNTNLRYTNIRARSKGRRIGIAGRAIITKKVQNVSDVKSDADYNPISPDINSQLSVPLKAGKKVIGVLSIEHPAPNAFRAEVKEERNEDQLNVELLSAQAAVALHNALQFGELKKTKGQVGSLSALAWMGMATSAWRHSIEGYAINAINTLVKFLRPEINQSQIGEDRRQQIEECMALIESEMQKILERPITPPLAHEEGVEPIAINDFIKERIEDLWTNDESYGSVEPMFHPTVDNAVSINCSRDWLIRAFDLLVDNAVKAMMNSPLRRLTVTSRASRNHVEIVFADTGGGIARSIRSKLFKSRIKTPKGEGLGMGLLMVKAIVDTYEGDVRLETTSRKGTVMVMSFPLATDGD